MKMEILDLAKHHREILERKFPYYNYAFFKPSRATSSLTLDDARAWIRVVLRVPASPQTEHVKLLVAFFLPSYVKIIIPGGAAFFQHVCYDEIAYADPRFTDDILSDKIDELHLSVKHSREHDGDTVAIRDIISRHGI